MLSHELHRAFAKLVRVVRVVVPQAVGWAIAIPVVNAVRQQWSGLVRVGSARAQRVEAVCGAARHAQRLVEVVAAAAKQPQVRVEAPVGWQV